MQKIKTAKNLKKTPPIIAAPLPRDPEAECQFELELCWCAQQLMNAINGGKLSKKLHEDTLKNLKTLKSSTAPAIKKRQIMKAAFGDYRSKMKEEEKKLALAAKQIKFTPYGQTAKKSSFVKKAAILAPGKDFKFNFKLDTSVDTLSSAVNEEASANQSHGSTVTIAKDFTFSSGSEFKFNFAIEGDNEDIALDKLSIKN